MKFNERLAFWVLKRGGYRLSDIWDSWSLVLADKTGDDAVAHVRKLNNHLLLSNVGRALDALNTDLVVDVGAHIGRFGMSLRRTGFQNRILSIEPNPQAFHILEEVSAKDAKWESLQLAISRMAGRGELHVSSDSSFSSLKEFNTSARLHFGSLVDIQSSIAVETKPLCNVLSEFADRHGKPQSIFLKSDTQGNDEEVLQSLESWSHVVRGIMVELAVRPVYEEVNKLAKAHDFYEAQGYLLSGLYPVSWSENGAVIEFDAIYFK